MSELDDLLTLYTSISIYWSWGYSSEQHRWNPSIRVSPRSLPRVQRNVYWITWMASRRKKPEPGGKSSGSERQTGDTNQRGLAPLFPGPDSEHLGALPSVRHHLSPSGSCIPALEESPSWLRAQWRREGAGTLPGVSWRPPT